jgi:hypothetical protein
LAPPSGEDIQPPVSDEDYKAEWYTSMAYQTGSSVMDVMKNLNLALSDELLPGPNDFYKFVETLFIPGNTCCVAALPFSNGSLGPDDLDDQSWQNFLASGDFLKILHVQKETVTDP